MHDYRTKIILGDFNANMLSVSPDATFVRKLIADNSLFSIPYGATHHTATSHTWLDLCLVDEQDVVTRFQKSADPFVAGHDLITATLNIAICKPPPASFSFRDFRGVDQEALNTYLAECDWTLPEGWVGPPIDARIHVLYRNLNLALEHFAPLKIIKSSKSKHPWFTRNIRDLIAERIRLYRRYRRTRTWPDLISYRLARDDAFRAVETARLDYYENRLADLQDPKDIWKELRHLGLCPRSVTNWGEFTAEDLNTHFASVSFDPDAVSLPHFIRNESTGDMLRFREITQEEVAEAINKIKSQAVGVDNIPQRFITLAIPSVLVHLTEIFNNSLSSAIFPDAWKRSIVLALNKIPSPRCLGDFRPISLLSFLSKVLERLVFLQIGAYVDSRGLLDEFQSGFRPGYSTQTALIKMTDDIRYARNKRMVTAMLLFDFSKAFDSVRHDILLRKLAAFNFSSHVINWIASYLSGRQQAVRREDGSLTNFLPINKGVPQGSILGPILFALYVGDVSNCFDRRIRHMMYADDLQIYLSCPYEELTNTLQILGTAAERITDWSNTNGLRLNVNKTKAIVFGTVKFINRIYDPDPPAVPPTLQVFNESLPLESSVRCLGVILDNKLNWKEHVRSICRKANSLMYKLYHIKRCTTLELRQHLVKTLLFPKIDYCSVVFADLCDEQDQKVQRVVNTGIRYIYSVSRYEHITPYRLQLGWLSTAGRRDFFSACL